MANKTFEHGGFTLQCFPSTTRSPYLIFPVNFEIFHKHDNDEDGHLGDRGIEFNAYYFMCIPAEENSLKNWKCRKCGEEVPKGLVMIGLTRRLSKDAENF